jgi:DNA helicase-2/ATP-dependent DNA helicase PcrA
MNYHQTKGREADTVIHVFLPNDYFGREAEPFEDASKLLNVAVSRARKNVVVLLPSNPHALVEPFGRFRM